MKIKNIVLTFAIALVGVLILTVGSARAVMIDTFDVGTQSITGVSSDTLTGLDTSEVIGGSRKVQILSSTTPTGTVLSVNMPGPGTGLLVMDNGFGVSGEALITWDANGDGLGGADLTDSNNSDSIGLELVGLDFGNVALTVTVFETSAAGGDFASLLLPSATQGENVFDFDSFANFTNVSFNLVDMITLRINAGASQDLAIDFFETLENPVVPEPTTVALLGIGLVGFGGRYLRRRSRRKSQS